MFWISFKFCSSYSIECSHYFAILACCWAISSTEISTKRQKWGAEWQQRRIRCQNCTYILYKTKTILINWEQEWQRNLEIEEMYHCFANILTWSFFLLFIGSWQRQQIWIFAQTDGAVCSFYAHRWWRDGRWENTNKSSKDEARSTNQGQKSRRKGQTCISWRVCSNFS